MTSPAWIHRLALVLVVALAGPALRAEPRIYVVREDRVVLRVRVMGGAGEDGAEREIVLSGEQPGRITREVAWPSREVTSRLTIEARRRVSPENASQRVHLEATLETPGRDLAHAERDITFLDTMLAFFEVARDGPRPLTLAVEASHTSEDVLSARPVIGAPVVLALEIARLENGSSIPLETNRLHTFVGESVGYAFRYGEGDETVSLEIRLLPVQLTSEVARVEIEVSGRLGSLVISRHEQWVTTKEATSSL